jgi:hypothetical protein
MFKTYNTAQLRVFHPGTGNLQDESILWKLDNPVQSWGYDVLFPSLFSWFAFLFDVPCNATDLVDVAPDDLANLKLRYGCLRQFGDQEIPQQFGACVSLLALLLSRHLFSPFCHPLR